MPNIQTRNESAKGAVHATTVEEKKYTFSDNCNAAQKADLLQILDSNFIAKMNIDEVLETLDGFFLSMIESDGCDDQRYRIHFINCYKGTVEFLNELKRWAAQGKDKDDLVDITIEFYSWNHFDDHIKWYNEMFRTHYLSDYTDGTKSEYRFPFLFHYEELSKTIALLKDWCNGVYDKRKEATHGE